METIDYEIISSYLRGLKPVPQLSVKEWADEYRFLPATSARPGKFKSSVTPYNIEIMEKLSVHNPAQKIIVKKSSQVGATEVGNNWVGYVIDIAPGSFLYIMPTDTMMKDTSKSRIDKMIESTPSLIKKIKPQKAKDKSNTILYKEFEGGMLKMVGANSPVGLSSTPVRFVYGDEVDRYPLDVGGEGSAMSLAETRTLTFGARKKIFITSTPTIAGISEIDNLFQQTGQRYYHVPCPFCGSAQKLVFTQLRYEVNKYQGTGYQCIHCEKLIPERYKTQMLAAGMWVPEYPELEDGITFGYHINALYSPYGMYSWGNMAKDYEDSRGSIPKEKVFINTKLGECYEEKGEKPSWENLYERAEDYLPNKVFKDVVVITAGADVQGDRIEVEIVGWMKGKRSQSIDYRVLLGDTTRAEVWEELAKLLNETWVKEDRSGIQIRLLAIDSGFNTSKVYEFTRKYSTNRVIPIKGRESLDNFFSPPKTVQFTKAGKKIGKVKVWSVGSSFIKTETYGFLRLQINHETGNIPDGYCHLPNHRDIFYFKGLTAEELQVQKDKKGFNKYVWVKKYERNEPLDCRVYARAASAVIGIDRWSEDRWQKELYSNKLEVEIPKSEIKEPAKKRRSSFWD